MNETSPANVNETSPAKCDAPAGSGEAVAWMYEYQDGAESRIDLSPTPFLESWVEAKKAKMTKLYTRAQPAAVKQNLTTGAGVEALAKPMSLAVAFDFADNPRPYHSLACPADTNGELYRALRVLAAEVRRLTASDARPVIDEAMVERALTEWFYDENEDDNFNLSWADVQKEYEDGGDKLRNYMRAALTAALNPENKS